MFNKCRIRFRKTWPSGVQVLKSGLGRDEKEGPETCGFRNWGLPGNTFGYIGKTGQSPSASTPDSSLQEPWGGGHA